MKRKTFFQFKQFAVHHERSTMKVGTDAVLLGAWANVNAAHRLLDIGTGTGVIALMLAQRTSPLAHIDAVEIETQAATEAAANFDASPWASRLHLHAGPIQQFHPPLAYDVIVSNPPYFMNSLPPPDELRQAARHTVSLDYQTLLHQSNRLLRSDGRLNVVLPYTEGLQFTAQANTFGLYPSRQCTFRSRAQKPVERWLLEFTRIAAQPEQTELVLYRDATGETWSDAYRALTRDFYLKL